MRISGRTGSLPGMIWSGFLLLVLVSCNTPSVRAVTLTEDLILRASSDEVSDGSLVFFSLSIAPELEKNLTSDPTAFIRGKFQETEFYFFPFIEQGVSKYGAVLGVPYGIKAALYPVVVTASFGNKEVKKEIALKVTDGKYASETLKVDSRHIRPNRKAIERINRDKAEVGKIYSQITRKKYWDGPFQFPIKSHVTSVFGTKRVFNGEFASFHTGLDLKAPTGTRVFAPASGVVVLAKNLFFTGNSVMVDHGYGLITLYAHLSKIKVKVGQTVKTGDLLGLSGMTGRASGPHLHWQVIVNKTKVNPMGLIQTIR